MFMYHFCFIFSYTLTAQRIFVDLALGFTLHSSADGRILFPSSKLSCYEQSTMLYEQPNFELQHIYRSLDVLAKESDNIQATLYKNSKRIIKRKTGVLYYDCTNYFFDIDSEDGSKQYGVSKEHRPNSIVQMGLFMDMSGIPLAFCINPGNQNEQLPLKPLEQQIMKGFELSKFVVCTNAGLSSESNRKFNNQRAEKKVYALDPDTIAEEAKYDGFYAVCTNLDDDPAVIAKINHNRWEIEESFRIMKSEFKARSVYLHDDNRIEAHFLTCFISLLIYRLLEKKLDDKFTCDEIISTIRNMNVTTV